MVSTFGSSLGLVAVLFLLRISEGKLQKGYIDLSRTRSEDDHFHFASKFGYGLGKGEYKIRARQRSQKNSALPDLNHAGFHVFLDEDWDSVESRPDCRSRSSLARKTEQLELSQLGEWSSWTKGTVSQNVRPHIWYFALSTCGQTWHPAPQSVIEYEIHMTQVDGSEFSFEMKTMLEWNCFVLMCLTVLFGRFVLRCRSFASRAGMLHQVVWILSAAMVLQYLAGCFHTLHLCIYKSNGNGIQLVDMLSEVLSMLSQVVVTTLLIALAMGYTLLASRDGHLKVVKLIGILSMVLHIVLVSFGKFQDEAASKYHENEGVVGWVLLSVRLMLLAWFIFAIQASLEESGDRLRDFLRSYRLAGAMYFLAYPLLFVVVQIVAPYWQHPVMQIGLLSMQTMSNAWLAELFLSRGTFFKVSALSSSFLPIGSSQLGMFNKLS